MTSMRNTWGEDDRQGKRFHDFQRNLLHGHDPGERLGEPEQQHDHGGLYSRFQKKVVQPARFQAAVDQKPRQESIRNGDSAASVGVKMPPQMPPMMITGIIRDKARRP